MTTNSGVIKCFIPQTISSDVKLRQKVLSVFNKRRSDFPNEAKYNDYLEHVEEIIFNAIEGIASATETEKILQKEKRLNAKEIKERKERNLEELFCWRSQDHLAMFEDVRRFLEIGPFPAMQGYRDLYVCSSPDTSIRIRT